MTTVPQAQRSRRMFSVTCVNGFAIGGFRHESLRRTEIPPVCGGHAFEPVKLVRPQNKALRPHGCDWRLELSSQLVR